MSCLGNIVWLIFGGFIASLGYIIGGVALCLTIIGIPFGVQSIKLGLANLAPFGKEVTRVERKNSFLFLVMDVIWIILFGWEVALVHLTSALLLAVTIIGIPFAIQHVKLLPVALFPYQYELK